MARRPRHKGTGKSGTGGVPHKPFVRAEASLPEFTWTAVLVGAILGIVFGASSLYLVLKVGMTVSASIPVAVLSITLFRVFSKVFKVRRASILENNIVQTAGSAGESIAFGVGVTMPSLMLLGFEMTITQVMTVSVLGGCLGILMMIPLRRAFIVKKHGSLRYPEGTACADVLIVGEQGGSSARTVFFGFAIALVYQCLWQGLRLWKEVVSRPLRWFQGAVPALEVNPALLGVGYIIGTRVSCIMAAGGVLASFVLIPMISMFGQGLNSPLYPGQVPIAQMAESEISKAYVLYVGAGAVAAGGIISLVQALPLIAGSIVAGLRDLRGSRTASAPSPPSPASQPGAPAVVGAPATAQATRPAGVPRTDRDLPWSVMILGTLLVLVAIWLTLPLDSMFSWINLAGAALIVLFGFLFVTVSSRLTGEIGSSSNPISGMTVATLLLTCLIFLALRWTEPQHRLMALSVAAIVCVAASNGGTTSQDLKTGFLVGATPKYQQLAILVGSISSSLVIGAVLVALNDSNTVYTTKNLPRLSQPLDVAPLKKLEKAPGDDAVYHVWQATEGNPQRVPQGKYLVDDQGRLRYLVDPGINGRVSRRDDNTEVLKFDAPKARLMSLITDGILTQKLPWTLVLLGVSLAVVLELCGVSSLPFAVGVYLPLSSSTPILVGGMVRYVADRWQHRRGAGGARGASSEMSPGVLLSTGYIAGGAIAGVVIAMLMFNEEIPKRLVQWQYRQHTLSTSAPPDDAYRAAALRELGLIGNEKLPPEKREQLATLTRDIATINSDRLPRFVQVSQGTTLHLPANTAYSVPRDTTLGEVARGVLGSVDKAQLLLNLNAERLSLPRELPSGTAIRVPQGNALALGAFGGLVLILALAAVWPRKDAAGSKGTTPRNGRDKDKEAVAKPLDTPKPGPGFPKR